MITVHQLIALAVWVGICLGAAKLGSILTIPSLGYWYANLRKPRWTAPNWVFGPVWTAIYMNMAFAAWLVWREIGFSRLPLPLFIIVVALNVVWSAIFFNLRAVGVAFFEVVVLWMFILWTTIAFWSVSSTAGWLMVPYLVWVGYASALNGVIWRMEAQVNPGLPRLELQSPGQDSPVGTGLLESEMNIEHHRMQPFSRSTERLVVKNGTSH